VKTGQAPTLTTSADRTQAIHQPVGAKKDRRPTRSAGILGTAVDCTALRHLFSGGDRSTDPRCSAMGSGPWQLRRTDGFRTVSVRPNP